MRKTVVLGLTLSALLSSSVLAADLSPLNPDSEPDRIAWYQVPQKFGPAPQVQGQKFGVVLKTLTNDFWRLLAKGYRTAAADAGAKVDVQAAQGESDQMGQLAMMENMIGPQYKALMISPQTDANLQPAIDEAEKAGIPVINVDDAVVSSIGHFVGVVQRENGVRVAKWFIEHYPNGGEVAIIEGQAGVFAALQRTIGFKETIVASGKLKVVASVPGNWDRQQSYDAAVNILQTHPKLVGIYANNDTMALGAVEAVKSLGLAKQVHVFGTDGTTDAYSSIKAGDMEGTVDSFPVLTGEIAFDAATRLTVGQKLPRVVATPQVLVTRENMARFTGDEKSVRAALIEDATSSH